MSTPRLVSDQEPDLEEPGGETSRGIPSPRRAEEPATGDTFTATSEGGTTAGPDFGSVVTPPGEGGILTGPTDDLTPEERDR